MQYKELASIFLILCLMFCPAPRVASGGEPALLDLGRWSEAELARIITESQQIDAPGERIAALSGHFLATPYVADTLVGAPDTEERLVINLAGLDCFTFLDLVEALRRAATLDELPGQLQQVRYRGGLVAYQNRRHFFSDWVADQDAVVADVTETVGQGRALTAVRQLNLKSDGTRWMPELPVRPRSISYIPVDRLDSEVLSALQAGDYVGLYSPLAGLDVSHTGLIVRDGDRVMLRHASSRSSAMRVIDEELSTYLQGKPGLLVYRAMPE